MKKDKNKRFSIFVILFIIVCVFLLLLYLYIESEGKLLSQVIQNITETNKVSDNYNGVYTNVDSLNGTKVLFGSCTLSHIDNYIVIINDDYYIYRSSCIGTFYIGSGKTSKLDIREDVENDTFYINYRDNVYNKDYAITSLEVTTSPIGYNGDFYPAYYDLLFKESQFEGFYYDVGEREIYGTSSDLKISFEHIEGESFVLKLNKKNDVVYQYYIKNFDTLPLIYTFGGYVAVLEKDNDGDRYQNVLKVFTDNGLVYDSRNMFPITVDDVELNNEMSFYIYFNSSKRNFQVIVSDSRNICTNDKKDVAYYVFEIDYNYSTKEFDKPAFVKLGYASEECKDIKEVVGG